MKRIAAALIVLLFACSGFALDVDIKQTNQGAGRVLISFKFPSQTKEGKTQVAWHSIHFIKKNADGKVLMEIPISTRRKGKAYRGLFTIDRGKIEECQIRISGNSSSGGINADHQKDFPLKKTEQDS